MKTYVLHNPLEHGDDLKPLQHALKNDKFYLGPIDGIFGHATAFACKTAKFHLGYAKKKVVPTGGQALLDYLTGKIKLPLAYKIRRRARGFGISKAQQQRQRIVDWALWGVKNNLQIHYTESGARSWWLNLSPGTLPMDTDCSGFATACYKWSKLSDPNGLGYRVVGYTGTMLEHGETIPLYQAKPGDLVIWGVFPGHHVAILVENGNKRDPMIVSHGSEIGPLHIPMSQENSAQRRPYKVKRFIQG